MTENTGTTTSSATRHTDHTGGAFSSAAFILLAAAVAATHFCDGVAAQRDLEAAFKQAVSEGKKRFDYDVKGNGLPQAYEIVCVDHGKANVRLVLEAGVEGQRSAERFLLRRPVHAAQCG